MTDGPNPGLGAVLQGAVAELEGVERTERGGVMELSTNGVPFAIIEGNRVEFRLAGPIAAAALRTPDTETSPRGADWVMFAPAVLDRHAIDRAQAWLASAWRRAAEGSGSPG